MKAVAVRGRKKAAASPAVIETSAVVVSESTALPAPPAANPQMIELRKAAEDRIRKIEDEVLEDSLRVVSATLRFGEVTEDAGSEPPASWVEQYGLEDARVRWRIAKLANLPSKEAPTGIKVAATVATGILKARQSQNKSHMTLNLQMVSITAPTAKYEELEAPDV